MPRDRAPRRRHRIRSLLGAALLGAGAVLQSKSRAEDHWSRSPAAAYDAEGVAGALGAPPDDDPITAGAPAADARADASAATRRAGRSSRWRRRRGRRGR